MSPTVSRSGARLLALVAGAWLAVPGLASAADVTIDTATRFQTMEGFGTCLPWWVNDPATSPLYDATLRSNYVKDLGFNILRVEMHPSALMGPAGTLDSPVELVDDVAANVAKFDFARRPVRLYGDFAQYVRDNVLEPGTFRLVGAFWTPPHWLKGPNGTLIAGHPAPWINGADANTCGGRLKQDEATKTQFARYVGAWIRGFEQQYAVSWHAVSLQNELIYETEYNSASYSKDESGATDQWWQYADALKAVTDYLKAKSITTRIMGPHHAGLAGSPANPWHFYEQMGFIDAVRNHASGNLLDALSIFASNDYVDGGLANHAVMLRGYWEGVANVAAPWAQWGPAGNISQYGKQNWLQETSGEANSWDKDNALGLAQKVHDGLVFGNASAYIYWLINDDQADVDTQTLLGNGQISTPTASKKYCAMKHFSRYIRPGAQRVKATFDANGWSAYGGSTQDDTYNSLNVSAYQKGNALTIVFVNMRPAAEPTTIAIPASLGITRLQSWRTTASESFAAQPDLTVSGNKVTVTIPASSVVTLTGQGGVVTSYTLAVARSGAGSGTVTSSPAGISCGATCSASYASGTSVTLTATAASGSTFAGFGGACASSPCVVTMTAARSVTATFDPVVGDASITVTRSGTGAGTVTSSTGGISCGSTCSASFAGGTVVTLTAAAAAGSTFGGWSGACSGTAATCAITVTGAHPVGAAFQAQGTTPPCANAITLTSGNSGNFNTAGAICYRTAATVNGWGCYNMEGRTVSVNGAAPTSACGQMPLPARWSDGYHYFAFTAGQYPWAGFYHW